MTVGTIAKRRRTATPPARSIPSKRGWIWALTQIALLAAEVFLLLFVLAQPAFRPQHIEVHGLARVNTSEVNRALDLAPDRNIFFLSQADLARRVQTLPWVKSATVSLALPDRISVGVVEWTPAAALQVGEATYLLNDRGDVLDPAAEAGKLMVINRPDFGPARNGAHAVSADLLQMLTALQAGFRPAFKVSVTAAQLDQRDLLTVHVDRGWTIIFGQMATSEQRATLEPKLAALRALSARLDLTAAPIQYINLENPGAPAVQMAARTK